MDSGESLKTKKAGNHTHNIRTVILQDPLHFLPLLVPQWLNGAGRIRLMIKS